MRVAAIRTMTAVWWMACALLACACGQSDTQGNTLTLPDATTDFHGATDAANSADGALPGQDVAVAEVVADVAAPLDVPPVDSGPQDAPPKWQPLTPLTLQQGAAATLDVNPLISDLEDGDADLKITWSAQHVALQDPGSHVLYVVAPTTWVGTEQIAVTVHDTAGLTATETLTVTVTEVKVDPPQPVDTCGKLTFAVAAGKGQHTVLLSGTFNNWAATSPAADALTDPGATGTWKVEKTLKPGVYQYKFIVDGNWQPDATNPNQVPDGYGGKNSVVEVPQCQP